MKKRKTGWFKRAKENWYYKNVSDFSISSSRGFELIEFTKGKKRGYNIYGGFLGDVWNLSYIDAFWLGWRLKCTANTIYYFSFRTHKDVENSINAVLSKPEVRP